MKNIYKKYLKSLKNGDIFSVKTTKHRGFSKFKVNEVTKDKIIATMISGEYFNMDVIKLDFNLHTGMYMDNCRDIWEINMPNNPKNININKQLSLI